MINLYKSFFELLVRDVHIDYMGRTIAIAKGLYVPARGEPKIWFESLKSMSQVLSNENQQLLKIIIENKPVSLMELEKLSHRKKSNLSRTLKTLERCGIVELSKVDGKLVSIVKATDFELEFGLNVGKNRFDSGRNRAASGLN